MKPARLKRLKAHGSNAGDQSRFVNALKAAEGLSEAISERVYWIIGDDGEEEAGRTRLKMAAA